MGRFISDTFKAVSAVRTVRQNQTRAQIETAWEKKKTLQFSIFCNTLALIMCRPHMLVELSYCSKKKNADSLQIWCHGGFIYCMSRRFGGKKTRTSFSLISRYSWGSGETSSSRLPLLSAVTWFAGWTCGTRRSWTAVQWTRWNLVDQHVNSAHLTFQGEAERFWMRPMFDTTQRQTFFLLFFLCQRKVWTHC